MTSNPRAYDLSHFNARNITFSCVVAVKLSGTAAEGPTGGLSIRPCGEKHLDSDSES